LVRCIGFLVCVCVCVCVCWWCVAAQRSYFSLPRRSLSCVGSIFCNSPRVTDFGVSVCGGGSCSCSNTGSPATPTPLPPPSSPSPPPPPSACLPPMHLCVDGDCVSDPSDCEGVCPLLRRSLVTIDLFFSRTHTHWHLHSYTCTLARACARRRDDWHGPMTSALSVCVYTFACGVCVCVCAPTRCSLYRSILFDRLSTL
jgi:hypothetical protein